MKSVIVVRACLILLLVAATAFFVLKAEFLWKPKPEEKFNRQKIEKSLKDVRNRGLGKKDKISDANANLLPVTARKSSEAVPVEVSRVKKDDVEIYLTNTCTLEPAKQVDVVAQIPGFVKLINVEEGASVELDQLLASLDEAKQLLELKEARVKKENAERVYAWSLENFKDNVVSKDEVEDNRFKFEIASVELEKRVLEFEYTSIESPIAGVIVERNIEEGDNVKKDQVVFKVADFDPVLARIYIPEKDLSKIKKGQIARIVSEFLPGKELLGKIKEVSPVVDPESGTVKVTIEIKNPMDGVLKPGMFVSVFTRVDQHKDALSIPTKALILEAETDEVFIAKDFIVMSMATDIAGGLTIGDKVKCDKKIHVENYASEDYVLNGKIVDISIHYEDESMKIITIETTTAVNTNTSKVFEKVHFYNGQDALLFQVKEIDFKVETKALKTKITLGFKERAHVEVLTGLNESDRVITVGQDNLSNGVNIAIINDKNEIGKSAVSESS
ncbi:MAG: efflux RND transporter periplasmic adaptor subunit [Planctomycetes bacterium]|nr:efflux RND transporter periplasmic adaptor subunit [Planctomycetota bacterium]